MARKPQPKKAAPPRKKRAAGKKPETKCRHGRPTRYTAKIADEILDRLSDGETLPAICSDDRMPSRVTVMRWADEDRQEFSDRYQRARERQRDAWSDDIVTIADDGTNDYVEREQKNGDAKVIFDREHVERSKLRVSSRQWLMKVGSPHKYGDKLEATHKADEAFVAIWKQMSGG